MASLDSSTKTTSNLKLEQEVTLNTPRMRYGFLASLLFWSLNLFYGRKRSLSKFKVLEVIARVPYQAWGNVAYIAMTHTYSKPRFARRVFEFVSECRQQQDNEQWHLFILEELTHRRGVREYFLLHRVLPQFVAFFYYHVSWILYVIKPAMSYRLNARFEDHAEHEYMLFVKENPQLEEEPFDSDFRGDYGDFASLADVFRQIALDERQHKMESLDRIENPRFS